MGDAAEVAVVNPTDYFLYLPLMPEVAAGWSSRAHRVSLSRRLRKARFVLGTVQQIDPRQQQ